MDNLQPESKVTILLNLLDFQVAELRRREEVEQLLFQWSTGLLLAVFGGILALSDTAATLSAAFPIKILASIIVAAPTLLAVVWIFRRSRVSVQNTKAIERIQDLLHLFESGFYGPHSPYPTEWQGSLTKGRSTRKTPTFYAVVIFIMVTCVIVAIWLVL